MLMSRQGARPGTVIRAPSAAAAAAAAAAAGSGGGGSDDVSSHAGGILMSTQPGQTVETFLYDVNATELKYDRGTTRCAPIFRSLVMYNTGTLSIDITKILVAGVYPSTDDIQQVEPPLRRALLTLGFERHSSSSSSSSSCLSSR